MKKFAVMLGLLLLCASIGWWVLGLPHTSNATVLLPVSPSSSSNGGSSTSSSPGAVSLTGQTAEASDVPVWRTNLQSAIAEARDQKKDVLLLFTGNGPSSVQTPAELKLESEDFRKSVSDRLILAVFDCHPDTSGANDAAATRDTWAQRLAVNAFPFLVLLDARGRACAGADLSQIDGSAVEPTIAHLEQVRVERDQAFARADSQSGIDQARSLDAGLQLVKPYAQASYQQVMEQILADDAADQAHLREIYFPLVTQSRIDLAVQHEIYPLIDRKLYQAAIDRITQLISEESPPSDQKQLLLAFQGQLFGNLGNNKMALATLDQAIAMAPGNPQVAKIKAMRDQIQPPASSPN